MSECKLSLLWEEITRHFPQAVFISYHEGNRYCRLKFLPMDSIDLSDSAVLVYDGKVFHYFLGIDDYIKNENEWRNCNG